MTNVYLFMCIYLFMYLFIYFLQDTYVISNCGTPTEKCSEFLDYHLKPLMQRGWSYIKDSGDFIKNTRNSGSIPENAILVTADVLGLYPSIPHEAGLKALGEVLDKRENNNYSY